MWSKLRGETNRQTWWLVSYPKVSFDSKQVDRNWICLDFSLLQSEILSKKIFFRNCSTVSEVGLSDGELKRFDRYAPKNTGTTRAGTVVIDVQYIRVRSKYV